MKLDKSEFDVIYWDAVKILDSDKEKDEKLLEVCQLLADKIEYYDWVGFYFVNPDNMWELKLGPYVGEPTDHVIIPFGKGICGQTAVSKKTFVVQDVCVQDNYLSCSPTVKSEIVVPILNAEGEFLGDLDIDSSVKGPFSDEDEELLAKICKEIVRIL